MENAIESTHNFMGKPFARYWHVLFKVKIIIIHSPMFKEKTRGNSDTKKDFGIIFRIDMSINIFKFNGSLISLSFWRIYKLFKYFEEALKTNRNQGHTNDRCKYFTNGDLNFPAALAPLPRWPRFRTIVRVSYILIRRIFKNVNKCREQSAIALWIFVVAGISVVS